MPAKIDITGLRLGRLVALFPMNERCGKYIVWKFQCDCGNSTHLSVGSFRSGNTKSCGCLRRERTGERIRASNKVGMRFGRLVVMGMGKIKHHSRQWKCKCDCGNVIFTRVSGKRTPISCGCIRRYIGRYTENLPRRPTDIKGHRFGKLIARHSTNLRHDGAIIWECHCDCGEKIIASTRDLRKKDKLSCGCLYDACRYVNGTHIDPMNVPRALVDANKLTLAIKRELKQAS